MDIQEVILNQATAVKCMRLLEWAVSNQVLAAPNIKRDINIYQCMDNLNTKGILTLHLLCNHLYKERECKDHHLVRAIKT